MIYLKNVVVNRDRKYAKSYGAPEQVEASLGILKGNWLTFGNERMNINGKHFNGYKGTEITEQTYNKHLKRIESEIAKTKQYLAQQMEQAYVDTNERIQSAIIKVNERREWLESYMNRRQCELSDLGYHKMANLIAFKLCSRFDCKMSDLRSAFKEVFKTN